MNKVIGTLTTQQVAILVGDHHIVTSVPVAAAVTDAVPEGCLLYLDGTGYKPLAANDSEHDPVAVALENLPANSSDAVLTAAVHGAVRTEKLWFADGSVVNASAIAKLGKQGIYAIGQVPPAASVPVIGTQPEALSAAKDATGKSVSVAASVSDGGTLSYKWYVNTTDSTTGGTAVEGGTSATCPVSTAAAGTSYYYCEVTNTLNNTTASVKSQTAAVTITE